MNILITGSRGTIGTALTTELERRGHNVWGLDLQHQGAKNYVRADVGNYRQLLNAFDSTLINSITPRARQLGTTLHELPRIDYVYHLAAEFGRLNGEEYYDTLWATNVIGTRNILELQRLLKFKLIFASSSEVYGECKADLLTEDLSLTLPLRQQNDYAMSKYVNEQQIMNFEERYGNECVRLRFFNAYGPGEKYHHYRSVVCLFAYRALTRQPYEVYEGYSRAFMYIDDFIPTLANVVDNFKAGEVYNIGGSEYRSVRELSDLILKEIDAGPLMRSSITYLTEDRHNTVRKRPDNSKAARDFGHRPKVTLEVGVPETLRWMRKEYGL